MISIYQRGKASMKRLGEIFAAGPTATAEANGAALSVAGAIEWDRVSFSYFASDERSSTNGDGLSVGRNIPYALRNVSVKVPAGGKLAIVGRTGSGKSTMVKLLARLIEPTGGRVLLDGRDAREVNLFELRRAVGLGPQETPPFFHTLARNIAFGHSDASIAEIESCARIAGLESDMAVLPRGLETVVGERGMSLSGGQKQRVTIARLLNYDPAVVVLDDALSSVDTETERAVLRSLDENVSGR